MSKTIHVELAPGEVIDCPNCHGTGDDPDTMICVMCGGDGTLGNDDDTEESVDRCEVCEAELPRGVMRFGLCSRCEYEGFEV